MDSNSQRENMKLLLSDVLWNPSTSSFNTVDDISKCGPSDHILSTDNNGSGYSAIATATANPLSNNISDMLFLEQQHVQQHASYPHTNQATSDTGTFISHQMFEQQSLSNFNFLDLLLSSQEQEQQQPLYTTVGNHPFVLPNGNASFATTTTTTAAAAPAAAAATTQAAISASHQLRSQHAAAIDSTLLERSLAGFNMAAPSTLSSNSFQQQQQQQAPQNSAKNAKRKTAAGRSTDNTDAKTPTKRKRTKRKRKTPPSTDLGEGNGQSSNLDNNGTQQIKVKRKTGLNKPLLLSPILSSFMDGEKQLPRPEIVRRLWSYIKSNQLQDPADRRFILCDEKLKLLFQKDRVNSFGMNKDLTVHLTNIDSANNIATGLDASTNATAAHGGDKKITTQTAISMLTPSDILLGHNNTSPVPTSDSTPDIMTPNDGESLASGQFKWN